MNYHAFVIKYAEVALKGKNRLYFEEALTRRIRRVLSDCEGRFVVNRVPGRVYVEAEGFDFDETIAALQTVFGITGICPAVTIERDGESRLPAYRELSAAVLRFVEEVYETHGQSFKVKCRRVDKTYPMESMEVDSALGADILERFPQMRVDVHQPEILLHVELREKVNIFSEILPGPGGMPTGTSGRAMLLLSGGIDSPVAGYMTAKRGVEIEAVYFDAPPYTSERARQKVIDLAGIIAHYTGGVRLHVVPFTDIQMYIYEQCPHDELTILMRRYMMRIAESLALANDCIGLITGESIGQVASQTMQSLLATNEAVKELPVYRPLIAFDKQEIIAVSQKIGAYETSILPYEDCCTIFVAKHPVTRPRVDIIRAHEKRLSEKIDSLVQTALQETRVIEVK